MAQTDDRTVPVRQGGILIMRGMKPSIPMGGLRLRMNEHGVIEASLDLHIAMDMTPHWLRLAVEGLRACQAASTELRRVWQGGERPEEGEALEREFRAAMQTSAAAAFAVDAFYASVQDAAPVEPATKAAWKRNRTARHAQISETLRTRFELSQARALELAAAIKKVFALRDEAVHPKAGPCETVLHPTIGVAVERRMGMFNYDVAKRTVEAVLNILSVLARCPRPQFERLVSYCPHLSAEVALVRSAGGAEQG